LTTPKLALPELVVGQAGKELTHNQALSVLDQLAQAVVVDKDLATPPVSPANGAMYIVASGAIGAWSGQSGKLAYWLTSVGAWSFATPVNGWSVWVTDEAERYELKAGAWSIVSSGGGGMSNPMTSVGDIIVGGASGTPARLAAGTSGQVLSIQSGTPAWVDPSGGGVSAVTATSPIVSSGGATPNISINPATTSAAGSMSSSDKTKLDGVATGATANSTDAVLLARANHTGTQAASTISDFDSAARAQVEAELIAGTNITITPSGSGATRQLTIASTGGGGGASLPVVQALSSSRSLALVDINTFNVNSTTSSYTATIPAQATVAWTADAEMHFLPSNTGDIVITAAAGVSLNGIVAGSLTISTQNGAASIKRVASDSWWCGGVLGDVVTAGAVQVGQSTTASNNFHLRNLLDGLLRISRGDAGSPITDVMTVNADNTVSFPGKVSAGVLGAGQTLQDVTGSRALSTTYTNTTGVAIHVLVVTGSNSTTVTIAGIALPTTVAVGSLKYVWSFIVPPGATYQVASGNAIEKWLEMR